MSEPLDWQAECTLQSFPRDSRRDFAELGPSDKSLGYYQMPLRGKAAGTQHLRNLLHADPERGAEFRARFHDPQSAATDQGVGRGGHRLDGDEILARRSEDLRVGKTGEKLDGDAAASPPETERRPLVERGKGFDWVSAFITFNSTRVQLLKAKGQVAGA